MKHGKHGNGNGLDDLYLAFEFNAENEALCKVKHFLKSKGFCFNHFVGESDFKGMNCIEIPGGECLLHEIEKLTKGVI